MVFRRGVARRTARRAARRATRRTVRRMRRRRIVIGGAVLLAGVGTYAAVKLSQKDAARIEQQTGVPVEELTEEELATAMRNLGIEAIELDENDQAIITDAAASTPAQPPAPAAGPTDSLVDELERLAALRDQGIITDEDFQAAKNKLLGL